MRNCLKLFFILSFNLVFLSLKAEWQLALINDADGFAYVRSGPGTSFGTIDTIDQNDLFYCEPASGDWWKIDTMHGDKGYMHKTRIKMVNAMPIASQKKLMLSIFKKQEQLADKYTRGQVEGRVTEAVIKKLPARKRQFIIDDVDWGLLNHFNTNEGEAPKDKQHIELKKRLDKITTN